jgi:hypothetical protein
MLSATQKARRNIKLLEEADHDAINKVGEPRFKKILTEQEKQLHHYLAQYIDPNYLPKGITKEYEFPKYFYYTVNSKKHGVVQKRTRTDSAMFKRFMKNKSKKEQAKAQGIFKITDEPIKININVPSTKKKNTKKPIPSYEVEKPQYENTGDIRMRIQEKIPSLEIIPFEGEELIESIPSHAPTKKNITIKKPQRKTDDELILELLEEIGAYEDLAPVPEIAIDPEVEKLKESLIRDSDELAKINKNIEVLKRQKQTKSNIKYMDGLTGLIEHIKRRKRENMAKLGEMSKFKNSDAFKIIQEEADNLLDQKKYLFEQIKAKKDTPEYNELIKEYRRVMNALEDLADYFPPSWVKKNKLIFMGFGLRKKLKPRRKFIY